MAEVRPIVYIVDDDPGARRSLAYLVTSVGWEAETFASGQAFLEGCDPSRPACLLLDLRMPRMSGLQLQNEMSARGLRMPTIMITAYAEVSAAVRALKAGAIDFIEKPFSDLALLEKINHAVELAVAAASERDTRAALTARLDRLTPREREVLHGVAKGQPNKQIAAKLGLSVKTIEIHRASLMRKMEVTSVAELVRLVHQVSEPPDVLPAGNGTKATAVPESKLSRRGSPAARASL
jgi:FixJ family two-component response regulator